MLDIYKNKYYINNKEKILKVQKIYYKKNKKRIRKRYKLYYEKNKQKIMKKQLNYNFKKFYGITLEDYYKLFKKQKGLCKICKQPETRKVNNKITKLHIDHNHKTGKVRGLLCSNCNIGLGNLKDSIILLKRAIKYLKGEKK